MHEVHDFENWLSASAILFPKCRIRSYPIGHRGVEAVQDIEKGEVVIQVPDQMVLYSENSSLSRPLAKYEMRNVPDGNCWKELAGLVICLMHEHCLGKESRWDAYIRFLPQNFSHLPMFWENPNVLKGTSVYEKIYPSKLQMHGYFYVQPPSKVPLLVSRFGGAVVKVDVLFNRHVAPFVVHCLRKSKLNKMDINALFKLYMWAVAVVSSYSFILGKDQFQALVPMWDALNHRTGKKNVSLNHCKEKKALQMIATKDIFKGQELINSFGELSSSELLRRYGFLESVERNIYNIPEVSVTDVARVCQMLTKKKTHGLTKRLHLLKRMQILPKSGWFRMQEHGDLDSSLSLCLTCLLISKKQKTQLHKSTKCKVSCLIAQYQLAKLQKMKRFEGKKSQMDTIAATSVRNDEIQIWKEFLISQTEPTQAYK